MSTEVRVPPLPESVADATVLDWHKAPGDPVRRDETLVDLETDKVVLEVPAPADGTLEAIRAASGEVVQAGQVLATLAEGAAVPAPTPGEGLSAAPSSEPAAALSEAPPVAPEAEAPPMAPAARRLVKELRLDPAAIQGSGKHGRILKSDVMRHLDQREEGLPERDLEVPVGAVEDRPERRVPMTRLRASIARHLMQAQHEAALLTTFNEVDMQPVMDLRKRHQAAFQERHGIKLGFMSFFVKAAVEALKAFPALNASVDGETIVYHGYYDIGIAIAAPRGLVVPVLRDADRLGFAAIEQAIADYAAKAREGRLALADLQGGTFSITNGGVFGSLLSTPIVNPPQSAILGMHAIKERPVAEEGEVVIRPMMYLALTYDHRLVDGAEAVRFLVHIKETLEDPSRLLLEL